MGRASVACAGACSCKQFELDAHHADQQLSVPALHDFFLYAKADRESDGSGADACQIQVTVLDSSSSGEHKFKVIGITASASPIWKLSDIFGRRESGLIRS
eukprot:349916-Chlamydomonas_euryale.AAC.1